jgi:BirA family transcriptional regulator, biotin operon repressor / biotin---[acetyl-CoA-carboxylase] ligase
MACRVKILDFERLGLFEAAGPEKISRQSPLWAKDIQILRPWTRMYSPGFDQTDDAWVWTSGQSDNPVGETPAILVCGRCASTMDAAWHFIETGRMRAWDSLIAVEQTAGRGQHQRQWVSPAGNIHASWRWPMPEYKSDMTPNWKNLMSLVAGFLFAQVMRKSGVPVQIKWPNDLLIHDRKFGGILIEIKADHILVGCGINLAYAPEDSLLRDQFAVPATHLVREGFQFTPLALWMTLVTEGKTLFETLIHAATPAEFIKIIDTRMAWVGKKVAIRGMNDDVFEAVILGLSKDGGLRIKKENESRVIYSGSIIPA